MEKRCVLYAYFFLWKENYIHLIISAHVRTFMYKHVLLCCITCFATCTYQKKAVILHSI